MCTKLNRGKPNVDFLQGDTFQESTYFSKGFCEEDSITNYPGNLLPNYSETEASFQTCLIAQHSPAWPQNRPPKQILTILLSFIKKNNT